MKNQLLYQMASKDPFFKRKVLESLRLIEKYISDYSYVSWSGGKDSNVVLDLCLRVNPKIKVMHIESGYGIPESSEFIKNIIALKKLNYEELLTNIDYIELCEEFGLPHNRSDNTQKKVVSMIKKNPANEWSKANKYNTVFWGIRAEESLNRKALMKFKGKSFVDKNGIRRISPIMDWKIKDVWAYHFYSGFPINPIYEKENCGESCETIRNTGWLSTDGENRGRLEWLRKNYPEQYQKVRELL
jgi:phosphoadenosine phosphosulfate reductase